MPKTLFATIPLLFATAAFAQEQCLSVNEIHRLVGRIVDRIELVPPDEAN
ncbi:hypothetical protein [Bradyrhizobium sp. Leo121]|nr:hypothetical protein [Bradyrhizobium sp. Leo121]